MQNDKPSTEKLEQKTQERKPAEVRRFEILYAARELFVEKGFDRVSMEDVAEKVKISKAAVYLYFPSKAELFLETIGQAVDKLVSDLEISFTDPPHRSTVEKLNSANKALQNYSPMFTVTHHMSESGFPDEVFPPRIIKLFVKRMGERKQRIWDMLRCVFEHGQNEGEIRSDLPAGELAKLFAIYGMLLASSEVAYTTAKEVLLKGILKNKKDDLFKEDE
jgi:AcrR family transcriptional regulator